MIYRQLTRIIAPAAILIAAAACTSGDAMANDDLARELETASGETGLLPASGRTSVVSAIEQTAPRGNAARPVASRGDARVNRETPAPAAVVKPAAAEAAPAASAEPVVAVEQPSPEPPQSPAAGTARDAGASAPLPLPKPQPNGRRRGGGVWTTGDVIRNAPFPINP